MEFRRKYLARMIHLAAVGGLCLSGGISVAHADAMSLGTVSANSGTGSTAPSQKSAPHQAPTKTPLKATQPTAVISRHYIQNNVPLSANYGSIAAVSPSVSVVDPNGPGLMENQGLTIRGLQDGQFNVTFDGIPWGDSNDFTHHSTSYFMANDIGAINVNRGPGSASTIGDATFGGTIAIHSKDPSKTPGIVPFLSAGSFNTQIEGVQFDTGTMKHYHDARAFLDIETLSSKGYLTNSGQKRQNYFFKILRPIGDNTVLSFVAMHDQIHQNVPIGATKAEISQHGWNYGLSSDPTKQNYYGYNYDKISTYFVDLGLKTIFANGTQLDNKLYTYGYTHYGFNGADPNGEQPNGTYYGANNVPGQRMSMIYQSVGDLLRLVQPIAIGDLKYGIWFDHQWNTRSQYEIDWTLGGALNQNAGKAGPYGATDRLMYDTLDSAQPYLQLDWHLTSRLTLTPGVKYVWFKRSLNAPVNQGSSTAPLVYSKTYSDAVPSIALHYKIASDWTAYGQVAKGFLAPNLNTFYAPNPAASTVKPETTTNYQAGTAYQTDRLTLSGDVYYIDFNNKVGSRTVAGNTLFYNQGGVIYDGVEGSATMYVGGGFSGYVNGSINSAKEKTTHQWIANAPKATAALGVIYNQGPVYGALLDKYVGSRYGDSGQTQSLAAYSVASLSLGYKLDAGMPHPVDVRLKIDNLLDKKAIYALAGYTGGANTPLYWTLPSRSFDLSVSTKF
ncbi:hypothetical protein BI364_16010 [Acidihalobacter yilgarnensis]|uniref:TonB-dependent receptor n=1 Tax=Acidihalobacter yilgarnensis TaxID=2819280 RepID=A0A1D8IRX9_9GAMM|nr:TonB-dependent receptor [Acidihalobacter yilgarnensis]AOU99239.1 hypothetical protein BI364_16010 [Acidihalobacter yilgarnensis]